MKNNFIKLIKWFCSKLTFNDLASAVVVLNEVLNNSRQDITLKPEEKPPHYRVFRVDTIPPLPAPKKPEPQKNWQEIKKNKELKTGKVINPVKNRSDKKLPPGCKCTECGAPAKYLYINNGNLNSQVKCKICGKTGPSHGKKRETKAKHYCPYCSCALFKWKESKKCTIYKCPNYKCSHYLKNKALLTAEEQTLREVQKYNPNFKLHYQYREYHISPDDLKTKRPSSEPNLKNIHHSFHTIGLVLTFSINLGLSARLTREALKGIFGISISHQTVINYINLSASYMADFIDYNSPAPENEAAADETYIRSENKWIYTWFIIDSKTRAVSSYNLSSQRDMQPALALIYECFNKSGYAAKSPQLITDGNPSYDSAVMAYNNNFVKDSESELTKKTVIGLKNIDKESTEYRQFKQLVERLNRTYKFHTRPRSGFKNFNGAVSLTTLFVAFYNFMRPHKYMKNNPPVKLDLLDGISLMPEKWVALIKASAY